MTFEQLDYFIASVESETFFDAAESMHTTQSTLSKQIRKLEKGTECRSLGQKQTPCRTYSCWKSVLY